MDACDVTADAELAEDVTAAVAAALMMGTRGRRGRPPVR